MPKKTNAGASKRRSKLVGKEYRGMLTPLKIKVKPVKIVGFDSEDDTRGTPLSFAFYDGEKAFYTKSADEALDYIYNMQEPACFVAHNLEYDLANLMKHCEFKYLKEMTFAGKLLKATLVGSRNYFMNSASFFAGSLKKMGDTIKLPKLEGNSLDPKYNIRDAEIPQVFMSKMQSRLNAMGLPLGLSVGQIAMMSFRLSHLPSKIGTFNHPDTLKAYYGGRVEMFYKGIVKEKVYVADINSSYPDVMCNFLYPDTRKIESSRFETHRFGVGFFKVRVPDDCFIPPLPYRYEESGRLFFPVGIFSGWWTYAEIREALSFGVEILEEKDGFGTNHYLEPFRSFVESYYGEREKAKAFLENFPDDPEMNFESLFLKLVMNNLYGKFSQWKDGTLLMPHRMRKIDRNKHEGLKEDKQGYFWSYKIPRKKAPRHANYLWGVHITSYARISLLRKLRAVHESGSRLIYCDTDSIMFTGEGGLKALDYGTGLGKMGLESFDIGIFRQAKGYLLCNSSKTKPGFYDVKKIACKGVPTDQAPDFIVKGMATCLKPMRLKEASIRLNADVKRTDEELREIGFNVWSEAEKAMRGIYIKRRGESGVTMPVHVLDIPEMEENSYGAIEDISHSLEEAGIRLEKKPVRDFFRGVVVPDDWFEKTGEVFEPFHVFESQKPFMFNFNELEGLGPGETWFRGEFLYTSQSKRGHLMHYFHVLEWLGEKCAEKKLIGILPAFVIGEEKLEQKIVDIILVGEYIEGRRLDLKVEIHQKRSPSNG